MLTLQGELLCGGSSYTVANGNQDLVQRRKMPKKQHRASGLHDFFVITANASWKESNDREEPKAREQRPSQAPTIHLRRELVSC